MTKPVKMYASTLEWLRAVDESEWTREELIEILKNNYEIVEEEGESE